MFSYQAMASPSAMLIYGDWLEEQGQNLQADGVRSLGYALRQAQAIFGPLYPTGSRYYGGHYVTESSDWDWYCLKKERPANPFELGWYTSPYIPDGMGFWWGPMNIIVLQDADVFDNFRAATEKCRQARPHSRTEVIKIFRECGVRQTTNQGFRTEFSFVRTPADRVAYSS